MEEVKFGILMDAKHPACREALGFVGDVTPVLLHHQGKASQHVLQSPDGAWGPSRCRRLLSDADRPILVAIDAPAEAGSVDTRWRDGQ